MGAGVVSSFSIRTLHMSSPLGAPWFPLPLQDWQSLLPGWCRRVPARVQHQLGVFPADVPRLPLCTLSTQCSAASWWGLRKFPLLGCESCFCERTPQKSTSHYKEHRRCTEPCGSVVAGRLLDEDRCARCDGTKFCDIFECTLDVCAGHQCGNFAYCQPWARKPQCRCFSKYQQTPDGCRPMIDDDYRCCFTHYTQPLIRAVWVPREWQATIWWG
mmetsp:Transcript_33465/g.77831  ORF Transcript_33465/g.77831 Transcript_33465/m.77831 type:complete len:215 (+) Transcript_33465:1295-1939(+)